MYHGKRELRIVALGGVDVCDGAHRADVMKKIVKAPIQRESEWVGNRAGTAVRPGRPTDWHTAC